MLDRTAGKNPHKNENRWYYPSIPSARRVDVFGQSLIKVSEIIKWRDNKE